MCDKSSLFWRHDFGACSYANNLNIIAPKARGKLAIIFLFFVLRNRLTEWQIYELEKIFVGHSRAAQAKKKSNGSFAISLRSSSFVVVSWLLCNSPKHDDVFPRTYLASSSTSASTVLCKRSCYADLRDTTDRRSRVACRRTRALRLYKPHRPGLSSFCQASTVIIRRSNVETKNFPWDLSHWYACVIFFKTIDACALATPFTSGENNSSPRSIIVHRRLYYIIAYYILESRSPIYRTIRHFLSRKIIFHPEIYVASGR